MTKSEDPEVTAQESFIDKENDTVEVDGGNAIDDEDNTSSKAKCSPCCKIFDGVAEAEGYAATAIGKGATLMSSTFLTSSLLYLADEEAGCLDVSADECTNTVFGLKPTSLIPMVAVLGGLLSAFLLPLVGAIIDFTPYRRAVGIGASILLIAVQAAQIGTVSATWFPMLILQAIAILGYDIQNTVSTAYFPELGRKVGEEKTTRFQASFSVCIFGSEIIYLVVVIMLGIVLKLNTVATAQLGQAVSVLVLVSAFGYGWKRLPHVPPLHTKPEASTIVSAGFKQLWKTTKGINIHYGRTLRWFFAATCFAEAGSNAFTALAVTYMSGVIQTTGTENGIVFVVTLIFSTIGAKCGSILTARTNPIISMQIALVAFSAATIAGGLVLRGPEQKMLLYVFGPIWGLILGWQYTAQHTFFSLCLPKGQEAELSGLYTYCQIILNWLPPLIFSVVNEAGVPMRFALMTLAAFLLIAVAIQAILLAPWEECRQLSQTVSKNIDTRTSIYADEATVAAAKSSA